MTPVHWMHALEVNVDVDVRWRGRVSARRGETVVDGIPSQPEDVWSSRLLDGSGRTSVLQHYRLALSGVGRSRRMPVLHPQALVGQQADRYKRQGNAI